LGIALQFAVHNVVWGATVAGVFVLASVEEILIVEDILASVVARLLGLRRQQIVSPVSV
jgi:hypothetical protein